MFATGMEGGSSYLEQPWEVNRTKHPIDDDSASRPMSSLSVPSQSRAKIDSSRVRLGNPLLVFNSYDKIIYFFFLQWIYFMSIACRQVPTQGLTDRGSKAGTQ